jgi:hypothetical protein
MREEEEEEEEEKKKNRSAVPDQDPTCCFHLNAFQSEIRFPTETKAKFSQKYRSHGRPYCEF